ncbi:MAG TPA: hypothetical protein ENK26_01330 [Gammaproteobacteria bacterium]|nr:hypothetical protein [Gammaproteobacteria bacterium]
MSHQPVTGKKAPFPPRFADQAQLPQAGFEIIAIVRGIKGMKNKHGATGKGRETSRFVKVAAILLDILAKAAILVQCIIIFLYLDAPLATRDTPFRAIESTRWL